MFPGRLHRYVLGELLGPTLLGLGLYTFTLLMNAFFFVARMAVSKDLGWDLTLRLLAYELPKILVLTIPMATLLGTMIAVGRLSADHEWVALQGAGLGPSFLFRPVAIHGLVASLACLLIYALVVPRAHYASRALSGEIAVASNLASEMRPRVFYDDLPGVVLFVEEIRPGTGGRLEGVLVYRPGGLGRYDELILASRGDLYPTPGGAGTLEVDLQDGILHAFRPDDSETYRVSRFGRYQLQIEPPPYLAAMREPPGLTIQDMEPAALLRELRVASDDRDPVIREIRVRRVRTELHQRLALPLASLLFAVLAFPLGITRARSGKGAGFALSLAVILVYWVVFTLARDQAVQGRFPVALGVWSANLVVLAWILLAYRRVYRASWEERGLLGRLLERIAAGRPGRAEPSRGTPAEDRDAASDSSVLVLMGDPSNRFFRRLDRYLGAQYLRLVLLALASTYLVYVIVELKGLLDGVFRNNQPILLVGRYFKYYLPGMLPLSLPVACLIGGVVTVTLLGRRGELTALKASGISMRRATVPMLGLTVVLCGVLFLVQDMIAPITNRRAQEVRDQIFARAPRTYGLPTSGRWTFGDEGRLYHYRLYDPKEHRFQGLSVFTLDRATPRIVDHRFASSAVWTGSFWELRRGWRRRFPANGTVGEYERFEGTETAALDPPEHFARREATLAVGGDLPEQMSIRELREQIRALQHSGYDTTRLGVAFFSKLSQPLTPLVMLLLGLPFGFLVGRRGSLYAVGVALVLVIVYWATFAIFNALGLETILPPVIAAWAPNVLYGVLGGYLLLYTRT